MELKELRDQSLLSESSMRELKDITSKQNMETEVECSKVSEIVIESGNPMLSKVSTKTVAWSIEAHM